MVLKKEIKIALFLFSGKTMKFKNICVRIKQKKFSAVEIFLLHWEISTIKTFQFQIKMVSKPTNLVIIQIMRTFYLIIN